MKRLEALDSSTDAARTNKAAQTCATQCTQKILVKIIAAKAAFNQSEADLREERAYYNALNGVCAQNAGGEYCIIVARRFEGIGNSSVAAGCAFPDTCPATCSAFATTWLADKGCCYKSIATAIVDPDTGVSTLAFLTNFFTSKCSVVVPDACPRVMGALRAQIVLQNLKWAWFLANAAAARRAILLDLAAIIGCRADDLADSAIAQGTTTSSSGFTTQAAGVVITVNGNADTSAAATSQQSALNSAITSQALVFPGLSALSVNDYASREDTSSGISVNFAESQILADANAASSVRPAAAVVAATAAILVARLL